MTLKSARWITTPMFSLLTPLNLLHKANVESDTASSHDDSLYNTHMLVRKVFLSDKRTETTIYITADDYYKLYINGRLVGQGPAPGYHFSYNVNQYDISDFLMDGENVIAVHVYYQGIVNRVWNSGDNRMGFLAEVVQNKHVIVATDATWKYAIANEFVGKAATGYSTQFIEDIDNRKKIHGWKNLNFDDSNWINAAVNENTDYTFVTQITPSVQVYNVSPVNIREVEPGNILVDFGKEVTGRLLVEATGESGSEIEIHYGEELENCDKVRSNMRCNCLYQERWILGDTVNDGSNKLETYDYKAFRYVQLIFPNASALQFPEQCRAVIKTETIVAEIRHYPFDDSASEFESSDKLLNDIWAICKNAVKIGTQEGYLDCPSREKGQYLGDATVIAQAHAYLTGDYRLFKKCLTDFALSVRICPGIMAVAPGNFMQEIADYSLQWPLQLLKYYHLSGDIQFLREMLPVAEGVINYFKKFEREDGLLENFDDKPVMVDWPPELRDEYDYKLMPEYEEGCNTLLNAYYIGAIQTVNEIKTILGQTCSDSFSKLKISFINAFYSKKTGLFTDSEVSTHSALHSNVLAMYFDLAPHDSNIVSFIKQKRLHCGVYFSYFVLKALAKVQEYDFIYELITCKDERSWHTMVSEGATACFESWGKDQKWNTSLCHPWASSPIIILIEDIAGIEIRDGNVYSTQGMIGHTLRIPESLDFMKVRITVNGGQELVVRK